SPVPCFRGPSDPCPVVRSGVGRESMAPARLLNPSLTLQARTPRLSHVRRFCYHSAMNDLTPLRRRARRIMRDLARLYPAAESALNFENPYQLLVGVILSAQCTDKRVNMVTQALFARYPDAAALASANRKELQKYIQSTGFFRNKAKNLIQCCQQLMERHHGQ